MSRSDRILVAVGGIAVLLAAAAGWILLSPAVGGAASADPALLVASEPVGSAIPSVQPTPATLVVDVEGAVLHPGIRELPAGSRVADAIAAAGGYGPDADLEAAAAAINLAQPLQDGMQVVVPRVGVASGRETDEGSDADGAAEPAGDGLVDLNSASADELEGLPGIGPVTVERIIDARRERPFASLDDAVERGVLNRGQREDLEGLATAR